MAWNIWLREKVAKIFEFLTHNQNTLDTYAWFVMVDDDTYVRLPPLMALLEDVVNNPFQISVATGRKFIRAPLLPSHEVSKSHRCLLRREIGEALQPVSF